jgi:hypothetical protein
MVWFLVISFLFAYDFSLHKKEGRGLLGPEGER